MLDPVVKEGGIVIKENSCVENNKRSFAHRVISKNSGSRLCKKQNSKSPRDNPQYSSFFCTLENHNSCAVKSLSLSKFAIPKPEADQSGDWSMKASIFEKYVS